MNELQHFLCRLWYDVSPVFAVLWACICWVMFPNAAYLPAAVAVGIAILLDLFTKLYCLAVNNDGYLEATRRKVILSETLWRKTKVKVFAYLAVMILAGLSVRVTLLAQLGIFLATMIYSLIFIREFQSVLENLIEAGALGLRPLLFWLRKKEQSLCDQLDCREETEEDCHAKQPKN